MIFRTYHEGTMYVIEAPEGSRVVVADHRPEELVVFEEMPGGLWVERRLPLSVVIKAARRGSHGLAIREQRSPRLHPEVVDGRRVEARHFLLPPSLARRLA